MMSDPTYDRETINANPIWRTAFHLSEIMNDSAPIGWGKYIYVAECMHNNYNITSNDEVELPEKAIKAVFDLGVTVGIASNVYATDPVETYESLKDKIMTTFKENS